MMNVSIWLIIMDIVLKINFKQRVPNDRILNSVKKWYDNTLYVSIYNHIMRGFIMPTYTYRILLAISIISCASHAMESNSLLEGSIIDDSSLRADMQVISKEERLKQNILTACQNDSDLFSTTAVYVYSVSRNAFLKQGDLTSLTLEQLQAVQNNKYCYKTYIGFHRTRLQKTPDAIGALIFGDHPELKKTFDTAHRYQELASRFSLSESQGILYTCDAPGWDSLAISSLIP